MFWLHEEDLPPGVGSAPFSAMHLAWLALFLALTLYAARLTRRADAARRKRAGRILGAAVFFFGLCEYGVTALIGRFGRWTLPLHVCSLMFALAPLHAWTADARPGSFGARLHRFLGAVIFHPGLPGTLAALLFPDWLCYPFWNYVSLSSFLAHGLLLVYGALILAELAEAPEPRRRFRQDLRASLLFMAVGAAVMFVFDRVTGTNYWFMAGPSADSPFLSAWVRGGYGGYLLAYALTVAVGTALWYGLRYFLFVRKKHA